MRKKVNISRDLESRRNISARKTTILPIIENSRLTKSDKENEINQVQEEIKKSNTSSKDTEGPTKRVSKKV